MSSDEARASPYSGLLYGSRARLVSFESYGVPTENSVLIQPVEFGRASRYVECDMFAIIFALFHSIRQTLRDRAALHAEILALRHQLLVFQRLKRPHKVQLCFADRALWTWLSQLWNGWRPALVIVKPETVISWHRRGFRLYWSWKSRHPPPKAAVAHAPVAGEGHPGHTTDSANGDRADCGDSSSRRIAPSLRANRRVSRILSLKPFVPVSGLCFFGHEFFDRDTAHPRQRSM